MPVTRVNCPNCGQPISADITQIFDVAENPAAKQMLLSGAANIVQCPHCGYQGPLATPIVYHDPEKELLMTYVPPEVNLPRNEQERLIGSLIQQISNRLPQEKRKGYLLQPTQALTLQGLVEKILEADGITKEMIDAQQEKVRLVQRLLATSEESFAQVVEEEADHLDEEFFAIISRLAEASAAAGDNSTAQALVALQRKLLPMTEYGRQIQEQTAEIEAAMESLRDAGTELTREKLLQLLINAPNETRLGALVSLARPGLDYGFFQLLSEEIDRADANQKEELAKLRGKLLELTQEIDQQIEQRKNTARKNLETILQVDDIENVVMQNLPAIDEYFIAVLNEEIEIARERGDLDKSAKLNRIMEVLQQASSPPELEYLEELVQLPDPETIKNQMDAEKEKVTPEMMEILTSLISQPQDDQELTSKLQTIYKNALRISMQSNLEK